MEKNQNLEAVYKQVPPDYWDNAYNNIFQRLWYMLRFRALRKILKNLSDNSVVLDVGCGSGFSMEKSIPKGKKMEVFGIDVSKENIEYAKKRRQSYNFQVAHGEALPYIAEKFDAVLYLDVIEHLVNPHQSLNEAYRVLKKDGIVIVLVVKECHWLFKIIWWAWLKLKGKVWHDAHLHIFDEKSLKNFLDEAGFINSKINKIHLGMSLLAVAKK